MMEGWGEEWGRIRFREWWRTKRVNSGMVVELNVSYRKEWRLGVL